MTRGGVRPRLVMRSMTQDRMEGYERASQRLARRAPQGALSLRLTSEEKRTVSIRKESIIISERVVVDGAPVAGDEG